MRKKGVMPDVFICSTLSQATEGNNLILAIFALIKQYVCNDIISFEKLNL